MCSCNFLTKKGNNAKQNRKLPFKNTSGNLEDKNKSLQRIELPSKRMLSNTRDGHVETTKAY